MNIGTSGKIEQHPIAGTEFVIEANSETWQTQFRLRKGDKMTMWADYTRPLLLDGMVALSPYWHGDGDFILRTPEEAVQFICMGEGEPDEKQA